MVHVHLMTYVLLRCALLMVHELILLPLRSWWFMCMKWHTCCYAVHSSWYISWYFCLCTPHGSCAWSDIHVATLCSLRGTWVDTFAAALLMVYVHEVTDVLLRCVFFINGRGAKVSSVAVYRHASMAGPTHSWSAQHINVYGEGNVDKNLFQLLATELKNGGWR